jgi:hypothetical protein
MFKTLSISNEARKLISLGLLCVFLAYIYFQDKKLKELTNIKLHEKPALTVAKVLWFEKRNKQVTKIGIEYNYNNIAHYNTYETNRYNYLQKKMRGKYFPLIVHADSPSLCKLLILPKDFEEFHLDFPDSLQWLLQDN